MDKPLFPHSTNICPYCGNKEVKEGRQTTSEGNTMALAIHCDQCDGNYRVIYSPTSMVLEGAGGPAEMIAPIVQLKDVHEGHDAKVPVGIVPMADCVAIMAHGYGDYSSSPGYGVIAYLELAEGRLRIVAWDDIDREDASHIIHFDDAVEVGRGSDESFRDETHPYDCVRETHDGKVIEAHCFETEEQAAEYGAGAINVIAGMPIKIYHGGQCIQGVRHDYENFECPDCGEPILQEVGTGESCGNCGHVH